MSVESWKEQYFDVPVEETIIEDAALHSLKKWKGLTPEVLTEHDIYRLRSETSLYDDDDVFEVDSTTCALCFHHFKDVQIVECATCPLKKILDGPDDCGCLPAYKLWKNTGDASQMIEALEKASEER